MTELNQPIELTGQLAGKHCTPCEGGVAPYTRDQARAAMAQLSPEWHLAEQDKAIRREFGFRNFYHTMSFVNALAHLANTEDHHPDLEVGYSYCRVRFSTHAINGLSENDFICAAKLDRIPQR
jgi:4a-hydroxytetrahydrobiopterin dehydratase